MTRALLLLAAVTAGALLLAACGGSESGSATTAAAAATTAPATTTEATGTTAAATTSEEAATTGNVVEATIDVVGGQPDGGVQTIQLNKGQDVQLTVNSDQPYEIHLHGYDIMKDAGPNEPAKFDFNADIDGVFEMEVEDTSTQIAKLVVNP